MGEIITHPEVNQPVDKALETARAKVFRLESSGFRLSRADRRLVLHGQLLTTARTSSDSAIIASLVRAEEELHLSLLPEARLGRERGAACQRGKQVQ